MTFPAAAPYACQLVAAVFRRQSSFGAQQADYSFKCFDIILPFLNGLQVFLELTGVFGLEHYLYTKLRKHFFGVFKPAFART